MTDTRGMATTTAPNYYIDPDTFGPWAVTLDMCDTCNRSSAYVLECDGSCSELVCDECATAGAMERDTGWSATYCAGCAEPTFDDEPDDRYNY